MKSIYLFFLINPVCAFSFGMQRQISSFKYKKSMLMSTDDGKESPEDDKKIGWKGLVQLITAGMGSPFLGDFEGKFINSNETS